MIKNDGHSQAITPACGRKAVLSSKPKVVITDYAWESVAGEKRILADIANVVALQTKTAEQFLLEAATCDALLNAYAGPITAAVMARMPDCKIIAKYGIGVDTVDLAAATAAGIIVTNNPTYCIEEVAEHTLALLLASARSIAFFDRQVRAGQWAVAPLKPLQRLSTTTLGLVGFGNIAREVAVRAAAFGMRVLYTDPNVGEGQYPIPATRMELRDLLAAADFVSLHPPLTPQTRHMINEETLGLMKPNAILINCSRGPVIDMPALTRALDRGDIAGAALDTTDPEPLPVDHPLQRRENVIINPHAAWYSEQAMSGLQSGAPNEVRRLLTGQWPLHVVNPEVKASNRAGL